MRPSNPRSSRAFATLMAIVLIGLVGVALAVLAALFASQARRTERLRCETQLRQMLHAGAVSVEARCRSWPARPDQQTWTVPLPSALAADGGALAVRVDPTPDKLIATIHAATGSRALRQQLTLLRGNDRWTIAESRLDQ